jgi:hypothetical protein
MKQELVAKAIPRAHGGAVQTEILQKCIGDVNADAKEIDLEVFARWSHTDYALELRGNRLWLFSVSVREVRA